MGYYSGDYHAYYYAGDPGFFSSIGKFFGGVGRTIGQAAGAVARVAGQAGQFALQALPTIAQIGAPLLGTVFGGPLGGMLGGAVGNLFGGGGGGGAVPEPVYSQNVGSFSFPNTPFTSVGAPIYGGGSPTPMIPDTSPPTYGAFTMSPSREDEMEEEEEYG